MFYENDYILNKMSFLRKKISQKIILAVFFPLKSNDCKVAGFCRHVYWPRALTYTDLSPVPSSKLKSILLHSRSVQLFRAYLLNRSREKTETRQKANSKQQASSQKANSSIHNECFTTISHQVQTKNVAKVLLTSHKYARAAQGVWVETCFFLNRISRTPNQPLKNISITEDGGGAGRLLKCFKCILRHWLTRVEVTVLKK